MFFLVVAGVYVLLGAITESPFTGDAPEYAESILAWSQGRSLEFIEPGHLLWRPLGYALLRLTGGLPLGLSSEFVHLHVVELLGTLAWVLGLAGMLAAYGWLRCWYRQEGALVGALAITVTHAVLGYAEAGSSYVPSLSLALIGLWALGRGTLRPEARLRWGAIGGLALAMSVFLWLPFVLAIPGALAFGCFPPGKNRPSWQPALTAAVVATVVGFSVYAFAWRAAGTDLGFLPWLRSSDHGLIGHGGLPRAAIGLARSLVDMGPVGMIAKRFLMHDPYNPVSNTTLLLTVGWRLAAVYGFLGLVLLGCLTWWRSWRVAGLFIVGGLPVLMLAVAWHGGSTDRYLPLFPLLGFAIAATQQQGRRVLGWPLMLTGLLAGGVSNVLAFSTARALRSETAIRQRLGSIPSARWDDVLLVTTTTQDRLNDFQRTYEGRAVAAGVRHLITSLIDPGGDPNLAAWRSRFARRVLDGWPRGITVWVSRRGFAPAPKEEWQWVEEAERGVAWAPIPELLGQLEWGRTTGNDDGFVELLPSERNRALLEKLAADPRVN